MDPFKRLEQTLGEASEGVADVVLGYQIAPGAERAAVVTLSVGILAFGTVHSCAGGSSQARLGAAGSLMLAAGLTAALNREDGQEARYAVPFGAAGGLGLDAAPPGLRLSGVVAAALGLGGLVRDLHRRGAVHRALRQLAGG